MIVESNFNISLAAKKIHISQSALSQMIKTFEEQENIMLFERSKGRLENLTSVGELFYTNAQKIIEDYDLLIEELREESSQIKGKIRIGIPPVVISVLFSKIIPEIIQENPMIKVELNDAGAYQLRKKFLLQELDIVVLLKPTELKSEHVEQITLSKDELSVFMDIDHPLANEKNLRWSQLNGQPLAMFDSTFMVHHLLTKEFERRGVEINTVLSSTSWDFLLNATSYSNILTIMPSPVSDYYKDTRIIKVPFKNPIYWDVVICRPRKKHYTRVEKFTFEAIVNYFINDKSK